MPIPRTRYQNSRRAQCNALYEADHSLTRVNINWIIEIIMLPCTSISAPNMKIHHIIEIAVRRGLCICVTACLAAQFSGTFIATKHFYVHNMNPLLPTHQSKLTPTRLLNAQFVHSLARVSVSAMHILFIVSHKNIFDFAVSIACLETQKINALQLYCPY